MVSGCVDAGVQRPYSHLLSPDTVKILAEQHIKHEHEFHLETFFMRAMLYGAVVSKDPTNIIA
jgi:hypothetical protein